MKTPGDLKDVKYAPGGGGFTTSIQDFGPKIQHERPDRRNCGGGYIRGGARSRLQDQIDYDVETPSAGFDAAGATTSKVKRKTPQCRRCRQGVPPRRRFQLDAAYQTPAPASQSDRAIHHHRELDNDTLTLYEPSQFMYGAKNTPPPSSGSSPNRLHVVSRFVGGAFGSKAQLTPRNSVWSALCGQKTQSAREAGRDPRPGLHDRNLSRRRRVHRIRIGAGKTAGSRAIQHEGWEVTSRPDDYSVAGANDSARLYGFAR